MLVVRPTDSYKRTVIILPYVKKSQLKYFVCGFGV